MLEESRAFNDYDYALVHVFEKSGDYFKFYRESVEKGRTVILDNSAYELGRPYNEKAYRMWIKDLEPTEYILPDFRNDSRANRLAIISWCQTNKDLPGRKIGVVHGSNFDDYCKNYKDIEPWVDKIAFSVESFFFKDINLNPAFARIKILEEMVEKGVINEEKSHHILGALSPIEYASYLKYKWIESVDTSNPVLHGLLGEQYSGKNGLAKKSEVKLDQMMHLDVSDRQKRIIYFNVKWFRANLEVQSIHIAKEKFKIDFEEESKEETSAEKEASAEYYRHFPIETYDLMVAIWGEEAIAQWCEITAFKYRMRLGIKDPSKIQVDLTKEKNYLNKAKELREKVEV